MSLASITVDVDDIDDILRFFDAILVERSVSGEGGPYAEVTSVSSRITLQASQTRYEFFDGTGSPMYWYRVRYVNSTTGDQSDASSPVQGGRHPALDILTVRELREHYLFGVDLTDDRGNPFPDSLLEFYIRSAVAQAEHILDLPITPKVYSDYSEHAPQFPSEKHDFYIQEFYKYMDMQLLQFPVEQVYDIRLVLPGRQEVIDFPDDWFQDNTDYRAGKVRIVPGSGNIAVVALGQTTSWLPMIYGWNKNIPNVFHVSYRAGFANVGGVPDDIRDLVGMLASFGPLNVAGDLILGAGIASESIGLDAISTSVSTTQSATNAGYGARLSVYREKMKTMVPDIRNYWKGPRVWAG